MFVAKEAEMQEKEMKLIELQEMYETRLLAMKVIFNHFAFSFVSLLHPSHSYLYGCTFTVCVFYDRYIGTSSCNLHETRMHPAVRRRRRTVPHFSVRVSTHVCIHGKVFLFSLHNLCILR